jgi:outer membrane protein assembly factor BamE (lipoprotein component of BamABCDE complex)
MQMLKYAASVLLSLLVSTSVFAQSIDERVSDLERRVEQLERQSTNQSASAANRAQIVGGQDGWKRQENWRSLKRGMTEADVKGLLGEPHRVNALGATLTLWYYNPPRGGEVTFGRDSRLDGWSEPRAE